MLQNKHFQHLFFVLSLSLTGAVLVVVAPGVVLAALAALAVVWFVSFRPVQGMYILLFLYPFLSWAVDFGAFGATRTVPFLSAINAPVADLWAVLVMAALGIHFAREAARAKLPRPIIPALVPFVLLVISGLLSLFNLELYSITDGLRYLARNILFFYAAYVLLPANILRTRRAVLGALPVLLAAGAVAVLWGLASLFVLPPFWGVWRRVAPFAIGGWAPLGTFHNDLAEVLVALLPLAFFWFYRERRDVWKKIAFLYTALMFITALLTFSRTAWIVMFAQAVLFVALIERGLWRKLGRKLLPLALTALVPLFVYMLVFSSSAYVASSTSARVDLSRIAVFAFAEHPLLGSGIGSYIGLVAQATAFRIEYGPPFDAHGVIQKLAAEQGVVGLITFAVLVGWILRFIVHSYRREPKGEYRFFLLAVFLSAAGAVLFQVFNTQYYTAKMWVPVGFALCAALAGSLQKRDKKGVYKRIRA